MRVGDRCGAPCVSRAVDFRPEPALGDLPVPTARPMDIGFRPTEADLPFQRTQAGTRELVEVEWVPTAHPDVSRPPVAEDP